MGITSFMKEKNSTETKKLSASSAKENEIKMKGPDHETNPEAQTRIDA